MIIVDEEIKTEVGRADVRYFLTKHIPQVSILWAYIPYLAQNYN